MTSGAAVELIAIKHVADAFVASVDPARIMRPPATRNYKTDPPRPVVCERLELDCYTLEDVVGHLPDHPDYQPRPKPSRRPANADGYYDVVITVNTGDGFKRRYAGRIA